MGQEVGAREVKWDGKQVCQRPLQGLREQVKMLPAGGWLAGVPETHKEQQMPRDTVCNPVTRTLCQRGLLESSPTYTEFIKDYLKKLKPS